MNSLLDRGVAQCRWRPPSSLLPHGCVSTDADFDEISKLDKPRKKKTVNVKWTKPEALTGDTKMRRTPPCGHDADVECDFWWSRMRQALLNEFQQDQQRVVSDLGKHHRMWSNVFLPLFLLSPFWGAIP
jgi:hypothetical protein